MKTRVVVTGIGLCTPLGNSVAEFWENLVEGRSGIRTHPNPAITASVGWVEFDPTAYLSHFQIHTLDRVSQMAVVAAVRAVATANLPSGTRLGEQAGVLFGTGAGGAESTENAYMKFFGIPGARNKTLTPPAAMVHAPAAQIGIRLGITGECQTYSTACSSSAVAIGEAFRRIRDGHLKIAVAGGAEALLVPGVLDCWKFMLCHDPEDEPGSGCRPFSADRTGISIGEAAAVLILESLDSARKRAAKPICEIVGYGTSNDATHITKPNADGQTRAMRKCLADAGIETSSVGYLNAHGTATQAGDVEETNSIKAVFGAHALRMPVSATKSAHGHLMGAAGAVEFAATALALQNQVVPPTTHWKIRDPQCDLDYVPGRGRPVTDLEYALSNSFAFGGNNAVLLARRWT